MNEMYFRISHIQKKMESNSNLQTMMKLVAGLFFGIFFCSLNQAETLKIAWVISMPFIFLLVGFNTYFIKRNKEYEFEIYRLELAD